MNTRSSRRSIHQAGNGRLSEMVGLPEQESHSIDRRPSAQFNVRSANCSEIRWQRLKLSKSRMVPLMNRNNALANLRTKAHGPATAERPSATIGGVDAVALPLNSAAERQTCRLNDPQDNHSHSNIASRKRRSTSACRPRGCRSASAARSFCEKPARSMLLERSTSG